MKNIFTLLGIITLAAAAGFSMLACAVDSSGDDLELFASSDQDSVKFTRTFSKKVSSRDFDYWTDIVVSINGTPAVLTGSSIYTSDKTMSFELRFGGEPFNSGSRVTAGASYDVKVEYIGSAWNKFTIEKTLVAQGDNATVQAATDPMTGTAASGDFEFSNGVITGYSGTERDIVIPAFINGIPVTEIWGIMEGGGYADGAFDNLQLNSVIIPDSVIKIGPFSFAYSQITDVYIPDGVKYIEDWAFDGNLLTGVIIPDSVTKIGEGAFSGNKLTYINIPNFITAIEDWAFQRNELVSIYIPDNVINIGEGAFLYNPLTHITIGANVEIGNAAFRDNNQNDFFTETYNSGGKQAGTYVLNNGVWTRQ